MNSEIWDHDSISIDEDGYVHGYAFAGRVDGEHDVTVSVTSYEYDGNKMNHVPHIVIDKADTGSIVAEPHANDSRNPNQAIENAKGAGEYIVKECLEDYVN
jgi:hypothetical protein